MAPTGLALETCPVWAWLSCPVRKREGGRGPGLRCHSLLLPTCKVLSSASSLPPTWRSYMASWPLSPAPSVSPPHPQPGFPAARLWLLLATGPGSRALQRQDDSSARGVTQPSLSRPHQTALRLCACTGSLLLNPPRCPSLLASGEDDLTSSWGNKAFGVLLILPVSHLTLPHLVLPHLPFRNTWEEPTTLETPAPNIAPPGCFSPSWGPFRAQAWP